MQTYLISLTLPEQDSVGNEVTEADIHRAIECGFPFAIHPRQVDFIQRLPQEAAVVTQPEVWNTVQVHMTGCRACDEAATKAIEWCKSTGKKAGAHATAGNCAASVTLVQEGVPA